MLSSLWSQPLRPGDEGGVEVAVCWGEGPVVGKGDNGCFYTMFESIINYFNYILLS